MYDPISLTFGRASKNFALKVYAELKRICKRDEIKVSLIEPSFQEYSNGNLEVNFKQTARESDCFVIQTGERSCLSTNDEAAKLINRDLVELLLMIRALKDTARRVTAVTPYYFYARSDKKDKPRIPIGAKLIGDLLETAGAVRILTMDLHSMQAQGNANIPVDQIFGMPKFLKYILNQPAIDLFKLTIVAPDLNGAKRCHKYARRLQASVERKFGRKCFIPITIINKERLDDSEHPEIQEVIGSEYLHGRDLVILDDEILGGGTLTEVLQIVSQYKIGKIFAMMSHGVLSGKALERINNSPMERLVITDTIEFLNPPEKIEIISVADDFAELIKRIHTGRSVSEMDVFGRIQE